MNAQNNEGTFNRCPPDIAEINLGIFLGLPFHGIHMN